MQGSAVAVTEHLLLTNCHVVMDRPLIKLVHEGRRAKAKLVAADDDTDRCVIRTDTVLTPIGGVGAPEPPARRARGLPLRPPPPPVAPPHPRACVRTYPGPRPDFVAASA